MRHPFRIVPFRIPYQTRRVTRVNPQGRRPGTIAPGATQPEERSAGKPRSRLRTPVDHQRSEFLRHCRARVRPEDVGLPGSSRARSGGLRREDVAALAGVSTSWYTWLEQGRDIRVSDEVLERVCATLRLAEDERTYLFALVQRRLPRLNHEMPDTAPPEVRRLVDALHIPAVALNLRCDVLAWNTINSVLYRDYALHPPEERNLLEILLLKPVNQLPPAKLESTVRRLMGALRFDYSKCAGDPKFEGLLRRLLTHSPLFRRLWRMSDVLIHSYGSHQFNHPRFGPLTFEHTSFVPDGHPYVRVVVCNPEDDAARSAVATVNAELAAARPPG